MHKLYISILLIALSIVGCAKHPDAEVIAENFSSKASDAERAAYQTIDGAAEGIFYIKFKAGCVPMSISSDQESAGNDGRSANGGLSDGEGGIVRTGVPRLDRVAQNVGIKSMTRIFPYSAKHEAKHKKYGLDRWYMAVISKDMPRGGDAITAALQGYESLGDIVERVETAKSVTMHGQDNVIVPLTDDVLRDIKAAPNYDSKAGSNTGPNAGLPFNDRLLPRQWAINPIDDEVLRSYASINVLDAWQLTAGDPRVIVSVVDGGVKFDHEDLRDNMWINNAEKNGALGVDDDSNGYIDDISGYNFADGKAKIVPLSHSTHVAGIISATNNNELGMCGIGGGTGHGDGVRIMTCQIAANHGVQVGAVAAAAIVYGADNGAVISQNSWGYSSAGMREKIVEDAIDYFIAEAGNAADFPNSPMKGGIVFFAAGNNGVTSLFYPEAYEPVIAVSATDHQARRAEYSNYGSWVDISAPGGGEKSATPDAPKESILSTIVLDKGKDGYGFMFGTSMACPMVSGVAALLVSANYGITNTELHKKILSSVTSLQASEPTHWKSMGSGLLNASVSMKAINDGIGPASVTDLNIFDSVAPASQGAIGHYMRWSVPLKNGAGRVAAYTLYYKVGNNNGESADAVVNGGQRVELRDFKWAPQGVSVTHALPQECIDAITVSECSFVLVSSDNWGNQSGMSNVANYKIIEPTTVQLQSSMVKSNVVLDWGAKVRKDVKHVYIYDVTGRVVLHHILKADINVSSTSIDVRQLVSGNYILKFENSASGAITYKFRKL